MSNYNFGEDFESVEYVEPVESPSVSLNDAPKKSAYELFRENVNSPVIDDKLVRFPVETRPNTYVNFRKKIDFARVEAFMKQTTRGKRTDTLAFSTRLIGAMFHHFDIDGKIVEHDGRPLHINSAEFVEMCGVEGGSYDAMLHFFGNDSTVMALGMALIDAAGYTQELASEDYDPENPR